MKKLVAIFVVLLLIFGVIHTAYSDDLATPTDLVEKKDYSVNLSNLSQYSFVALNNLSLGSHTRGSVWVGGTLTSSGSWNCVDDGSINHNLGPSDSYVAINNSGVQFKGRTGAQSSDAYYGLTDGAINNTRNYWRNIIANADSNDTWIYLEPDENGHVDISNIYDYQCPGSDESQSSINKVYWTDATSVSMAGLAGHLIAPYATVSITWCNHCGSIVANNIVTNGEAHINYWTPPTPPEKPTPTPEPTPTPTPLTVTKILKGEIWSLRCDTMDNTDFKAGGGYWMADINNPAHNTSKEGHRSNHCGNRENWVLFVSEEGVAISLYQLKSGSTGGTLPSLMYRAPADLASIPEGQFIYDPTDPDDVMTKRLIEEVFIPSNVMPFEEVNLVEGQRLFWISQNGKQVWHHTGVLKKTTPRFAFIINGEPYTLGVGETITLTEVEDGLLEIEEIASSNYKMVEITNDGEGNYIVINEIDPPDKPTPTPPPPVVTPTPTPSPTPSESPSESPSPSPTPSESPSESPSPSPTPSESPSESPSPSPTPSESPSESPSPSPTPMSYCTFKIRKIVSNPENMENNCVFFFKVTGTAFEEPEYIEVVVNMETGEGTYTFEEIAAGKYTVQEIDIPEGYELVSEEEITQYITGEEMEFVFTNKVKEPEPSPTPTPTATPTDLVSPSPTPSESPSPTPSESPSVPPTTVTPSEVPTSTPTPTPSPTPTPTVTTSPIPSEVPTESPTVTPEETEEPEPSEEPEPEPSEEPEPSPEPEPTEIVIEVPEEEETPTKVVTVIKVWDDDENVHKSRPEYITLDLFGNDEYVATVRITGNGSANVTVPISIDGVEIQYTWNERIVTGYQIKSITTEGDTTTIVNSLIRVPEIPQGMPKPKTTGKTVRYIEIDEYETALGIPMLLNHVGDCFD